MKVGFLAVVVVALATPVAASQTTDADASVALAYATDMRGDAVELIPGINPDLTGLRVDHVDDGLAVRIVTSAAAQPSGFHGFTVRGALGNQQMEIVVSGNPAMGWTGSMTQGCAGSCPQAVDVYANQDELMLVLQPELLPGGPPVLSHLRVEAWISPAPSSGALAMPVDFLPNAGDAPFIYIGPSEENTATTVFREVAPGPHTYYTSAWIPRSPEALRVDSHEPGVGVWSTPAEGRTNVGLVSLLNLSEGEQREYSVKAGDEEVAHFVFRATSAGALIRNQPSQYVVAVDYPESTIPARYPPVGWLARAGNQQGLEGFTEDGVTTWNLRFKEPPRGGFALESRLFPSHDDINVAVHLQSSSAPIPGVTITSELLSLGPGDAQVLATIPLPNYPGSVDVSDTVISMALKDAIRERAGWAAKPASLDGREILLRIQAIHGELPSDTQILLGPKTAYKPVKQPALDLPDDLFIDTNQIHLRSSQGAVNAGEFNHQSIILETDESARLSLELVGGHPDWQHELERSYVELRAGRPAEVQVLFGAPADATNGEYSNPYLVVTGDGRVPIILPLYVEVVDFEVKDQGATIRPEVESPGVPTIVILGCLLLVARVGFKPQLRPE